jgi:hypothetical protein
MRTTCHRSASCGDVTFRVFAIEITYRGAFQHSTGRLFAKLRHDCCNTGRRSLEVF